MSDIRTFFNDSELATYEKIFPELTIPTMGIDPEGMLATLAASSIEQVKFLNTFAGVPLDVLYENVGQKHKASNVMALSMLKKTGDTGGSGLELIDIPDDGFTGTYSNIFLSAAETGDSEEPEEPGTLAIKCPDNLWKAQNELINRQIFYMKDIKDTYAEKRQDLPQGFSMRDFVKSDWFKWAVDALLELIPGDLDDAIYALVQKHALKTIAWALVWLQKAYYAGSLLLAAMADENAYLLLLNNSFENYKLRSTILTQHDQSIQSLLAQVSLAESQASQKQTMDAEKEFFKKEALSERVFECPFSGLCLGEKNGAADVSEFDIERG